MTKSDRHEGALPAPQDRATHERGQSAVSPPSVGIPSAWPTFNLNREVAVKLTPIGLRIMEERHNELLGMVPSLGEFKAPKTDEDGWTRFQLWSLIQEFGQHVDMGIPTPFETTIALDASAIEAQRAEPLGVSVADESAVVKPDVQDIAHD